MTTDQAQQTYPVLLTSDQLALLHMLCHWRIATHVMKAPDQRMYRDQLVALADTLEAANPVGLGKGG